ncbi:MAG: diguanylate cyclase [Oscillospiraceae bacterium]|nr:diguanylate cyclase [Oscillospiraceae bacterium]
MDKILVIDDSPVQGEFLRSILSENFEITICQTGREGLLTARNGNFSLILLDIIMPDMDGYMLLRELKASEVTKYIPVVLITSLSDVQHEEKGLLMGAVDYITKPFSPVIIKARVKTHIQLYHYQMKFKAEASVDALTGVANRRRYEEESVIKWQSAIRFKLPFTICMFDIDNFKAYNDTYGHPAGDKVLSAVAACISSRLQRSTDFFARYGGEEFVALYVGDDATPTFEFMKSIRQAVEDLHISHSHSVSQWVTVSVGGVTHIPTAEDSFDTYLKIADTMLYDAKRFGRNQVVWSNANKETWREKP